ncbi:MAG: enoyl-CoA hydratase/isomerase family protein [Acidobacteriota bacterium]|nr:enoyl-CoA hydratase/isomerase family protein [Acidobacteriota bacterium]
MSGFETILYEKNEGIAWVTLNRPQALNAFSVRMRDELYEILQAIKADDEVRVAVLKGAGEKAFCAGADLKEFLSAPSVVKARQIRSVRDLWKLFLSVPQPLIAALHGYVLGSGIEIALYCDLRIATPDSVFGLPEVDLGILPAAGGTQTLPRVLGLSGALDMLLTGRRLDGQEAFERGLVSRIVPREKLLAAAVEAAQRIASFDPRVVQNAKQAVIQGLDLTLDQGLDLEWRLAAGIKNSRH